MREEKPRGANQCEKKNEDEKPQWEKTYGGKTREKDRRRNDREEKIRWGERTVGKTGTENTRGLNTEKK